MDTIQFEKIGDHIGLLTLNRPDRLNAVNRGLIEDMHTLLDDLADDEGTRVLVITGAGRGFCAGTDLKEASAKPGTATGTVQGQLRFQARIASVIERIIDLPQPVIAAINGPAAGLGLALALASDVRIASSAANFIVANVRIGLSAGECGISWLFPRLVGLSRAFELMLTGRSFDAVEAEKMGLLSRVVAPEELREAALDIARAIAANPYFGVAMSKELVWANLAVPNLRAAIALENRTQILCVRNGDMAEGVRKFREKSTT